MNRSLGHEGVKAVITPALYRAQALGRIVCSWHTSLYGEITLGDSE